MGCRRWPVRDRRWSVRDRHGNAELCVVQTMPVAYRALRIRATVHNHAPRRWGATMRRAPWTASMVGAERYLAQIDRLRPRQILDRVHLRDDVLLVGKLSGHLDCAAVRLNPIRQRVAHNASEANDVLVGCRERSRALKVLQV